MSRAGWRTILAFGLPLGVGGALVLAPGDLRAQDGSPLPTLSELGLEYLSPAGTVQLGFSGRLDVEGYAPGDEPPWLIPETRSFATGRLRLFTDLFVGDAWFLTAELRVDGGEAPERGRADVRMEQLFVRWTADEAPVAIQAGRFVSPFGSYPLRHHTHADPLIRPPIMYEFRTMVSSEEVPGGAAGFMQWKTEERASEFRPIGAPPVWGAPYPWGVMVFGARGRFNYRAALVNSAPSSEPEAWSLRENPMTRPSVILAAGWQFVPSLRVEAWFNRGPYLQEDVRGPLPTATYGGPSSYNQILWGGEVLFQRGHNTLRLEALHDTWQVPNLEYDPVDISYSVEAHRKLGPSWFVAGRFGAIEFSRMSFEGTLDDGTFVEGRERWDHPVRRLQLGGGWRPFWNAEIRAEYAWNWTTGPVDPMGDLFSIQLWWEF